MNSSLMMNDTTQQCREEMAMTCELIKAHSEDQKSMHSKCDEEDFTTIHYYTMTTTKHAEDAACCEGWIIPLSSLICICLLGFVLGTTVGTKIAVLLVPQKRQCFVLLLLQRHIHTILLTVGTPCPG